MKAFEKDHRGSALAISVVIVLLLSLMMAVLLEKIVPASRQVRGIENATLAAYKAESAIETALWRININQPGTYSGSLENLDTSAYVSRSFSFVLTGSTIPTSGNGNSEYDPDWNRLGTGKPLQLYLPSGTDLQHLEIDFRVPDVKNASTPLNDISRTLSGGTSDTGALVNWTLSKIGSSAWILIADTTVSPALFTNSDTNVTPTGASGRLWNFRAKDVQNTASGTVGGLYPSILGSCSSGCILKLSLTKKLSNSAWSHDPIPYLEYRVRNSSAVNASLTVAIPLQYATINANGLAYGFKQSRTRQLSQLTTSEALDFAVFQ